jgi:SAM-dependent methyltransferase
MRPPRLYTDLAAWWPLFSHPDDYAEEADWIIRELEAALGRQPADILELGSGGGNTASHLARFSRMTLVELQRQMIDVSKRHNPSATHVQGDMRDVRLERTFDAVLIHDAITYMTNAEDLVAALTTARVHLKSAGVLIVLPDAVLETIESSSESGGHDAEDGSGRGLRYLEWTHAPNEDEKTTYDVDYGIILREADGSTAVIHDRHVLGLFPRSAWRDFFIRAGFAPPSVVTDPWQREVFIARPRNVGNADADRRT